MKEYDQNLVRFFVNKNPQAFATKPSTGHEENSGQYPLHLIAEHCSSIDTLNLIVCANKNDVNKRNEFGQKPIQILSQRPAFKQKCDMQIQLLTAAESKPRPLDVQRTICQSLSVQAFSTMSSEESDTHIIDLVSRLLNLTNDLGVLKRYNGPISLVMATCRISTTT